MKLNNNDDSHNSGLNLLIYNMLLDIESHPAWVCGLKLPCLVICPSTVKSHPAWVCGLKPYKIRAWFLLFVTPCVGVWIETHQDRLMSGMRSHTLRGCVDWNSNTLIQLQGDTKSHPAWVCGLKRLLGHSNGFSQPVTPCVGVWIETKIQVWGWSGIESHTLRGCVDWNFTLCNLYYWPRVTPCVGVWIETSLYVNRSIDSSHTLRGCVDWNFFEQIGHIPTSVTPCVGVWIETPVPDFPNFCLCHTLRGCVDWNRNVIEFTDINYSHTLRGCVDWNTRITGINCGKCRHTLRGCVDWNWRIERVYNL